MIRKLTRWGGLYIIVLLWIGGLYWEQNLAISQTAHDALACVILISMGALVNKWVHSHASNFLALQSDDNEDGLNRSGRSSNDDRLSEK